MGRYRVSVREVRQWTYTVEAKNHDAAYEAAKDRAEHDSPDESYFEEDDNEEVAL